MKKELLFFILLYSLIYSCNVGSNNDEVKVLNINTSDASEEIPLSKIGKNYKIVQLHTDSVFLIGDIRNIVLKNNIYVQNFQKILVFSNEGEPLYSINSTGKSGSEYYEINDFYVDTANNVIELWDRVKRRMFIYDNTSGLLLRSYNINLDANYFKKVGETYFFYSNGSYASKGDVITRIYFLNKEFKILDEYLKSDYVQLYAYNSPSFLCEMDNAIYHDEAPLSRIFNISEKGCQLVYSFNIDNNTMSKEDYLSLRQLKSNERFYKLQKECSFSEGRTKVNKFCITSVIWSKGKGYYCFYNPKNDHYFLSDKIYDDINLKIPIWYSNICDDKLICQIPAYKVISSEVDYEPLSKTNPELYRMIKNLKKFDNPILIISDLKEF